MEADENENEGNAPAKRKTKARKRNHKPETGIEGGQATSVEETIKQEKIIKTEQTGCHLPTKGELQAELNGLLMDEPPGEFEVDVSKPRDKTVINLDDGTLSYVSDVESGNEINNRQPETYYINYIEEEQCAEVITPDDHDPTPPSSADPNIEQILAELAEGSLALVSSLDPEHEDRVLNEIYMLNKKTGELCENPLDIPEHIVKCIMNVMQLED